MTKYLYTAERAQQILVSLLKQAGIRKVVASPGTTNISFVASLMHDSFFEVYSSVDERSAAYLAVGLSEESGEPVVITCTGATASRNYVPGLTEAFYRKIPVLAVTATQNENRIGHMIPQVIDRSSFPKDVVTHSEHIPIIRSLDDEWDATIRLNRALLALKHRGGGPVHINLPTTYCRDFSTSHLPEAHYIQRYTYDDNFPPMLSGRVGILVGNHKIWPDELKSAVNSFCDLYGAVIFCEHGSNYEGKYAVYNSLVNTQEKYESNSYSVDLLIHIGEVSGYGNTRCSPKTVWRVSEDGELRDPFKKLSKVFEVSELFFFKQYVAKAKNSSDIQQKGGERWLDQCHNEYRKLISLIPDLPFSNIWLAQQTAQLLPKNSVLHLGILNSLRTWGFFEMSNFIREHSFVNTGGFGIDGCMSSMIGGALARPDLTHFLVIGDLAFFYDLNVLGNRHIKNNVRILLVNNGKGTEFRNYNHMASMFGNDADALIAAAGHNGNKSEDLVRHFAKDLGYDYLHASNKSEYMQNIKQFVSEDELERPIIFEVFTTEKDESDALFMINNLVVSSKTVVKKTVGKALPKPIHRMLKGVLKSRG